MPKTFPSIFQRRSYFFTIVYHHCVHLLTQNKYHHYNFCKILFRVIPQFCTDAQHYHEMGPIGYYSYYLGVMEWYYRDAFQCDGIWCSGYSFGEDVKCATGKMRVSFFILISL
jgi:hypothetical protein